MARDPFDSSSVRRSFGLSRRRLLRSLGAAGALAVAACSAPAAPTPAPAPAGKPADKPAEKPAGGAPVAAPATGKEPVKLSWWNNQPMSRTQGLWEAVVKDIEDAVPNVKIETVIIPLADFEPKMMAGLAGKNAGDLVDVHPIHAFTFAMRGALLNLNPYMKNLGFPESDYTPAWKYNQWKGKYWAVPRSDNPTIILYNKKMVTEAGLPDPFGLYKEGKWDIAAWDRTMAGVSKGEGEKRVYGARPPGSDTLRLQCVWIWGAGGDLWNQEETATLIADDPAIKAWDYLADYTKNKWSPMPAEANIPGGAVALMGQRRMVADWPGAQFVLGGQAQFLPDDVQKEMHLVAMNKLWNGKNEVRNATNAQGIYPESKFRDDAWNAQAVTLSETTQKKIIDARWTAPLRKSWLKSDMWIKSLNPSFEDAAIWEDSVNNVRYHPHVPRFVEIDKIAQTAYQEIILGRKSSRQAMGEAKTEIDKILKEVATEAGSSPHLK
jgi:ABC-type glycerol-3-phosphate transport system substrate-binding protein